MAPQSLDRADRCGGDATGPCRCQRCRSHQRMAVGTGRRAQLLSHADAGANVVTRRQRHIAGRADRATVQDVLRCIDAEDIAGRDGAADELITCRERGILTGGDLAAMGDVTASVEDDVFSRESVTAGRHRFRIHRTQIHHRLQDLLAVHSHADQPDDVLRKADHLSRSQRQAYAEVEPGSLVDRVYGLRAVLAPGISFIREKTSAGEAADRVENLSESEPAILVT